MFVDYYKVLEVNRIATKDEIKIAFRNQAKKWHPDKNLDVDVNEKMQLINEAYLILKDDEARDRYDVEYDRFYDYLKNESQNSGKRDKSQDFKDEYANYQFNDDILYKWILNAKKQAVDLAKETIREVKELSVTATVEAGTKMIELFVSFFILSVIGLVILLLVKMCS